MEPGLVVGKVTPTGEVTEYVLEGEKSSGGPVTSIVSAPDGDLWFSARDRNAIGRVTTAGAFSLYPLPTPKGRPTSVAAGPDGNVWFTLSAASKLGRITPAGEITEFPLQPGRRPSAIVAGPDGNLWFTERGANRVGRITPAGEITEFEVPGPPAGLSGIAAGPDGNLWFAEAARPRVGRITPAGEVTQFGLPTADGVDSIVAGQGGQLWFSSGREVGAISPSGTISWPTCLARYCEYPPGALAVGPDGALWMSSGPGHCPGLCGGGSEIAYLYEPGFLGRYTLPPLRLAIGPRAAPVRGRTSSITLACGLPRGCEGLVRLGRVYYRDGKRRFRVAAEGSYDLSASTARRIAVHLLPWAIEDLRLYPAGLRYLQALAGPLGHVEAERGQLKLVLPSHPPHPI